MEKSSRTQAWTHDRPGVSRDGHQTTSIAKTLSVVAPELKSKFAMNDEDLRLT